MNRMRLLGPVLIVAGSATMFAQFGSIEKDKVSERDGSLADNAWCETIVSLAESDSSLATFLGRAEQARRFAERFPKDRRAPEARRLEAVYLIDAVAAGSIETRERMEATVEAFRRDGAVSAYERAIVAGTYEFTSARERVHSLSDLNREYEAVARNLIHEFPDQPQGYISLLTQAWEREVSSGRELAREVASAEKAPPAIREAATRLVTRLDLVGQRIDVVFDNPSLGGKTNSWREGKAGLIYIWATWSPDSLAFGEKLKARLPADANVVSVCLDTPDEPLALGTVDSRPDVIEQAAATIPGVLVRLPKGVNDDGAVRLGADAAPLLYFVGADGRVTDVHGTDDLEEKLQALGF